jgi:hypothetical protein
MVFFSAVCFAFGADVVAAGSGFVGEFRAIAAVLSALTGRTCVSIIDPLLDVDSVANAYRDVIALVSSETNEQVTSATMAK